MLHPPRVRSLADRTPIMMADPDRAAYAAFLAARAAATRLRKASLLSLLWPTGISAGKAAAVAVTELRRKNARIGERSSVPPMGGIKPRKMLRYGSQIVESGPTRKAG